MTYAVIMAGGVGTRFWPKSTKKLPKQFLQLFGSGTMLQNTVNRIKELIPIERVVVVTNSDYTELVKEQLPDLPVENVIGEPVAKNTAPCVAISAALLNKKADNPVMVVLPADHHITEKEKFLTILQKAINSAEEGEHLVTIGIKPDRPETGYGYIEAGRSDADKRDDTTPVKAFREKPGFETAKKFLEQGNYYWNSGMFIWKAESVMSSFKRFLPDMYAGSAKAAEKGSPEAIARFYHEAESISIDYGIMEHAQNVYVVPGEFGWNDVGSWRAVHELSEKDKNGNASNTKAAIFESSTDNLISAENGKAIAVVGLDHIAVVETEEAILVCNLNKAQDVKKIVEKLKGREDLKQYL